MKERPSTMDVHALLRRLRAGEKDRQIARALQVDRKTVKKYRAWAEAQGLLAGPLLDLAALEALRQRTYDRTRRHSALGNRSPMEFEQATTVAKLAVH